MSRWSLPWSCVTAPALIKWLYLLLEEELLGCFSWWAWWHLPRSVFQRHGIVLCHTCLRCKLLLVLAVLGLCLLWLKVTSIGTTWRWPLGCKLSMRGWLHWVTLACDLLWLFAWQIGVLLVLGGRCDIVTQVKLDFLRVVLFSRAAWSIRSLPHSQTMLTIASFSTLSTCWVLYRTHSLRCSVWSMTSSSYFAVWHVHGQSTTATLWWI